MEDIHSILGELKAARQLIERDDEGFLVPTYGGTKISVPDSYLADDTGRLKQVLRLLQKGATPEIVLAFTVEAGFGHQ